MSTVTGSFKATRSWGRAIIVVFCIIVQCVLASAQTTSNSNILIMPFGVWQICESAWGARTAECASFTPGSEQFLLMIKASQPETTEYLYTIVATMQDGSTRAVSGQLKRKDNSAGYSSTNVFFGGVAVSFNTTVEEATIAATQTGVGSFRP
jgi:hypothetical protein